MLGTRILHYQIQKALGEGGMGKVYLARDLDLGRQVAIKVLSADRLSDAEARRRFLHEAKAQAMLSHPNVVTFFEVAEHQDTACIIMEYVEGRPLSKLIASDELSPGDVLDLAIQIAEGVHAAHQHGIVHRDIKPDNVMVTPDLRAKITDFGLARWKGATTLTQRGTRLGSAYYMSPEQAEGHRVDHRTDIFSIGVILYEMLCRRRPFEGDSEAVVLYELVNSQPQPVARYCRDASESVQWIVGKCLAKSPDERYQSAADLVADLKRVRHDLQTGGAGMSTRTARRSNARRRRTAMWIAVSAAAIVGTVAALIPRSRNAVLSTLGIGSSRTDMHLVVIPLTGLGEHPPSPALLDGLLETLTSKLTQMESFHGSMHIVPVTDVRRAGITSVREARQAFGATHVVTGSFQDLHDRIRVTMNLVDARREVQLRSSVIDESSASASSLQDSTVLQLAAMLSIGLESAERQILIAGGTRDARAYDAYLLGRGHYQRAVDGIGFFRRIDTLQLDSSIADLGEAIRLDPEYALAYAALGEAYFRKFVAQTDSAWLEPALAHTLQAIELDRRLPGAFVTLGRIHAGTGRYTEAVYDFRQAADISPLDADACRGMGDAYAHLGRLQDAESTYRKLIDAKPDDLRAYYDLEMLYLDAGRYDDARALLRTVVELKPEGYESWNEVGDMFGAIYYQLGEWGRAAEAWERSLTYGPSYAAYSNLGTVQYMQAQYVQAAHMYERALEIDDRDYRVWINLASVYEQIPERAADAIPTYRRAIEMAELERAINPRDASILSHLSECYATVKDSSRALALARRAMELSPENIDVVVRSGLVYEQLGVRDTALQLIERALALGFPRPQLEALPGLAALFKDPRMKAGQTGE